MENDDWKAALGAAFNYTPPEAETAGKAEPADALAAQGKHMVDISLDKRNRHGKKVTLITGLLASDEAIDALAAELKRACGVGGSARGGEILIQGDHRAKILETLKDKGFKARVI